MSNEFHTPSPSYDHDGVFLDLLLKPKISKKPEYSVYLYKKANINGLEEELEQLTDEFMARNPNEYTVDEN